VLTGFLGKTTLLNRILTGDHGLRRRAGERLRLDQHRRRAIVGIENEGNIINLANGCVCCNVRDDLVAA
jgi:G3E family GTPase